AVSHDAPHTADIMDAAGNPRPHSHRFSWGFAQLIGHFIQLPADQDTKEKMADICKHSGFWPGFLALCAQLEWRLEAFTIIVHLDDISLLDGENGLMPETVEEWRVVLELAGSLHEAGHRPALHNGDVEPSGSLDPESVALLLAKTIGPERALAVLQDSGLAGRLSHRFTTVCDILSIAEKRQRHCSSSMCNILLLLSTSCSPTFSLSLCSLLCLGRWSLSPPAPCWAAQHLALSGPIPRRVDSVYVQNIIMHCIS
uniref:HPS5 TPR domain-containing protein n=1 Tax=Callorhinchus milii TaxID=7868 RepID=A0A4W3IFX4_CALMI